ncbi:Two-component response regulator [Nitrincola lacisaponensis]|uniref:Two-component response regulator n=1 Tax=Nitrincola lacisaponensis TaxID=267850 RepID=A0A063Y2Q5_9GAMM|nr:diguanylate cyclase [Nitrincola lacisaponensis]KDE39036.1 Two-component response regulator [Nitrincola lacisaponensis]
MENYLSIDGLSDLTLLQETAGSELWLARSGQESVVLKRSKRVIPGVSHADMLRGEYDQAQQCVHPKLISVRGIASWNENPILVREYFEGLPLDQRVVQQPLSEIRFLHLAVTLCETLQAIHQAGFIHAQLAPEHILVSEGLDDFRVIGLGRVQPITQTGPIQNTFLPEQSPYQAPEQHPHSGVQVDERSDIYSLGAIFYLMLTGKPASGIPTDFPDSMDAELCRRFPDRSAVLWRIIAKMLASDRCQRYPSMDAVLVDLNICLQHAVADRALPDFELDHVSEINRLFSQGEHYGRDAEREALIKVLQQSAGQAFSCALVQGVSGIGKSSLVNAVQQAMSDQCRCIQIKYDQYASNSPLDGLFSALQQLLRQLLSESSDSLQQWGETFRQVMGDDAALLLEAIPELTLFIGLPPEVAALPAADAKVRLYRLLTRFVQTLASTEHPLCLFLDDCQWADAATLEWLESALHELHSVVVIFAFRDDEEHQSCMLAGFLQRLRKQEVIQQEISLAPLTTSVVAERLVYHFKLPSEAATTLADMLVEKTQGNPFYMAEYLRQCQRHHLLWFDQQALVWKLDLDQQAAIPVSENVVQLLAERLTFLADEVQQVLSMAACIGNRFNVELLHRLLPSIDLEQALLSAQTGGWLVSQVSAQGVEYCFPHDRIQQAAYGLMDKIRLQQAHLSIAECLEQSEDLDARLLECVYHYNAALEQINQADQLIQVGRLNRRASMAAKANGDFALALQLVIQAMRLLSGKSPEAALTAEILKERAECEHLCGYQAAALHYYQQALTVCRDARQRTRIYELLIKFHTDYGDFQQAFETGREALQKLDFSIPDGFSVINFAVDYLYLKRKLQHLSIEDLLGLPDAEDPGVCDQILLLSAMQKAAYQIRPELCVALAAKQVRLCLKHGNTCEAVVGYMVFGVIFVGGVRGHAHAGCEYGRLSLAMLERYHNQMQSAEVPFVYGYFAHSWLHPASDTERYWQRAFEQGLKIGDWFHAGCAAAGILQSQLMRGHPLEQILQQCDQFQVVLQRIGASEHEQTLEGIRQAILNLRHPSATLPVFNRQGFDEKAFLQRLEQFGSRHFAHLYFINKMWVLYSQGYYEDAASLALKSQSYLKDSQGMLHGAEHCFLHALILAKTLRPNTGLVMHRKHLRIKRYARQLQRWADQCPDNFLDRAQLVQGELHRLAGRSWEALSCYQDACKSAEFNGHLNLQILAHQLMETLYTTMGQRLAARSHQAERKRLSEKWGIDNRYLQDPIQADQFDLDSLAQAVEVISQERRLPRLLETLMSILLQNTLAQRCVLMLHEDQQYRIQAESRRSGADTQVMQNQLYDQTADLPHRIINYVLSSQEAILLDDACHYAVFEKDPYLSRYQVLSVICMPLVIQGQLKGLIYLESDTAAGVFTQNRFVMLRYLGTQIAISIDNALVYQKLEQKVSERTQDIEQQKQELQSQYDTIRHLNQRLTEENDERKLAEQKLQQANQQLQVLATTDGLTGLSNRRHFNQVLQQQYHYCKRLGLPLALLICDLDEFKAYNDHYGHQTGDDCLIAVAECFKSVVKRPGDLVARYGGEEFAVILPATDAEGAQYIAEQIHQAVNQCAIPHAVSSVVSQVTMSIGLYVGPGASIEQLILRADKALYQAKSAGKSRTCEYRN